jgi:hypothetical protein
MSNKTKMLYKSSFKLFCIRINFTTDDEDFFNFISATLKNYELENNYSTKFEINSEINFNEPFTSCREFRISNNVFLDQVNNKLEFRKRLFKAEYQKEVSYLSVKGYINNSISIRIKEFLKQILINNYSSSDILFHKLYRELILLPVFWLLRNYYSKFLMHASAISVDGFTFVFLGNDGVGKTTVALKLINQDKATFFGDNFLFYNQERVYPFLDTLRVNKSDKDKIKNFNSDIKFSRVFEGGTRIHYNFDEKFVAKQCAPTHFFVLMQGDENRKKKISETQFINYVYSINDYVKEFDKYDSTANLSFLYNLKKNIVEDELNAISKLVKGKECAIINLRSDIKADELLKLLLS